MKHLALIFSCILVINASRGQNMYGEDPKPFTGALLLGLNFSQVDGDSYYGYHKVALNAGAMVYVHFTPVIGASMELLYSRKGSRGVTVTKSPAIGDYISRYYMDINYVEVPLLFHAIFGKYDGEFGGSFNYLINSKEEVVSDQPVVIDPVRNRFNDYDVDIIFGFTRKLYQKYFVNVRYEYSLTFIRPSDRIPYGYSYGFAGQFNNLFCLRLVRTL